MIRIFCDENIRDQTVSWLREYGCDVTSVKEAGLCGATDAAVMEYAIANERILLTFNADFTDKRKLASLDHFGIIRLRFKDQAEDNIHPMLKKALKKIQDSSTAGLLITVQKGKLRLRTTFST